MNVLDVCVLQYIYLSHRINTCYAWNHGLDHQAPTVASVNGDITIKKNEYQLRMSSHSDCGIPESDYSTQLAFTSMTGCILNRLSAGSFSRILNTFKQYLCECDTAFTRCNIYDVNVGWKSSKLSKLYQLLQLIVNTVSSKENTRRTITLSLRHCYKHKRISLTWTSSEACLALLWQETCLTFSWTAEG